MTFSTADLLDFADIGVRDDEFYFELLDANRNAIGTLDVTGGTTAPHVRNDTSRSVFRNCTGVQISAADLSGINTFTERVRASVRLQNGDVKHLGVFMFGEDHRTTLSWGQRFTPDLGDETYLTNQSIDQAVGIPPGASIRAFFLALLAPLELPDIDITVADVAASVAITYPAGTKRGFILNALAALLGCYPPFFNNNGTYTLKHSPIAGAPSDHIYESGGRTIEGSTERTNSLFRAPNRWIVIGDDASGGLVGTYDLPDAAPNSYANTSRIITNDPKSMPGLATQELADLAAYIEALTDRNTYSQSSFASTCDPRHDTFDLVTKSGVQSLERAWDLTLTSGGAHTHELTEMFA